MDAVGRNGWQKIVIRTWQSQEKVDKRGAS